MEPAEFARMYHTIYQRLAAQHGIFASGQAYEELPGTTQLHMEAVAHEVIERMRTVLRATECQNIGTPENGDVLVVRYLEGMPSPDERRKDYTAIRNYFQMNQIQVRILGVSGEMSLDKVSETEMATFGWFKKR